jgi:hypothetical protein
LLGHRIIFVLFEVFFVSRFQLCFDASKKLPREVLIFNGDLQLIGICLALRVLRLIFLGRRIISSIFQEFEFSFFCSLLLFGCTLQNLSLI